jgi:hypothetical protein
MRHVTRWSETGNSLYQTASITRTRTPLPLDLIDRWLSIGHVPMDWITNSLQARGLVDASWWFAWPCIAYTQVWYPWLNERQDEHTVEIEFDQLSADYRAELAALDEELESEGPTVPQVG